MVNEIDILHEGHSCNLACHTGEKAAGILCIVSYHHEIIVKLGEYSLDTFVEPLVSPNRRAPVFLILPIRNFKGNVGCLKEILLHLSAEVTLVSEHHAVMILPAYIVKIMEVMYACGCHVIRMYDTSYAADSVEFISIVAYALRCAISPVGRCVRIVTSNGTAFRPGILAYLYRLGINAEHIFGAINCDSNILADFFCKTGCQFASGIELPSAYQVWQIILALMVQAMRKEVFAIESECLGGYAKSHDFKVGKLWNNTTTWYVSVFIYTISGEILADSEDSDEICYEVAHKQANSS